MVKEGAIRSLLFVLGMNGPGLAHGYRFSMVILRKTVSGLTREKMELFLRRAKRAVKLRGDVNVLITSSADLQSLNRRFRGKDKPTDVLSFPSLPEQPKFAGDIAISAPIAAENARRLKHSTADEIKVLILHGLLHLAGCDHERDNGAMARREALLRTKLSLPVALIERIESENQAEKTPQRARAKPVTVNHHSSRRRA
jgi:probable rRNA maturation factor